MATGLLDGSGFHVTRARVSSAVLAACGEVGVSRSHLPFVSVFDLLDFAFQEFYWSVESFGCGPVLWVFHQTSRTWCCPTLLLFSPPPVFPYYCRRARLPAPKPRSRRMCSVCNTHVSAPSFHRTAYSSLGSRFKC